MFSYSIDKVKTIRVRISFISLEFLRVSFIDSTTRDIVEVSTN